MRSLRHMTKRQGMISRLILVRKSLAENSPSGKALYHSCKILSLMTMSNRLSVAFTTRIQKLV